MKRREYRISTAAISGLMIGWLGACSADDNAPPPRPPGSGPAAKSGAASTTGTLPPGHPPIGTTAQAPAGGATTDLPAGHPPIDGNKTAPSGATASGPKPMPEIDTAGVAMTDTPLTLTGVSFTLPAGWVTQDPGMNPSAPGMSRKAQIKLPKADNEPEDAEVAITHFPGMKGPQMNQANLDRWYGQMTQPDGRSSVEVATKTEFTVDGVQVILIDVPGTLQGGGPMMGGGASKENYRLLAAIVDHDKGPHFIKVTGPDAVVQRYRPAVVAFLKSAKVNR